MMLCKKALEETSGDMDKAVENLRKQGEATMAKRAGKEAKEGTIAVFDGPTAAVMLEVNSETDFVARNEDFVAFVKALGQLLLEQQPDSMDAALALSSDAFGGQTVEAKLLELTGRIGERITFRRFHVERCEASERVLSYVHGGGKIGVLVKLRAANAEAVGSEAATALGRDCAMQVAAANPMAVSRADIPEETVAKEKEIYLTQAQNSGKPEKVWERIVDGKLGKFYQQVVLLEQEYIKDTDMKVADRVKQAGKECGAELTVVTFTRYERGIE